MIERILRTKGCMSETSSASINWVISGSLTLPYLTFGVGRLLHLPSAEAVSVRPNAQPRCNQKVTVIGCETETSAVKPNKSPATWDWWRVVWLFLSGGLFAPLLQIKKSSGSSVRKPHHHAKVADLRWGSLGGGIRIFETYRNYCSGRCLDVDLCQ